MIEGLKGKQSLKAAELQDGDIICFQRMHERKSRLGLGDNKSTEEAYVQTVLTYRLAVTNSSLETKLQIDSRMLANTTNSC
jgi:hypothetical protein